MAIAELSTAHMTPEDNEYLGKLAHDERHPYSALGRVIAHGYGYFVSLHYDDCCLPTQASWARSLRSIGFSATFVKVVRECKKAGFTWVYFDRDADTVDGLPTVEW
jgi:hypothetical protein